MCKLFQRSKRSNESIYLLRKTWYGGRSLWLAARRGTKVNPDRATWVLFRKCQLDSSGGGAHYRDGCNRLSANILFLGFKKLVILRYPFRLTDLRSACIAFIQLPLTNLSPSHEWWMFVTKFLQHGSSPIFFSFKHFGYNSVLKCVYMSHYFCNYLLDLLPLEQRHKSFLTRSQHKALKKPFPPKTKTKKKKECNHKAWGKETSTGAS